MKDEVKLGIVIILGMLVTPLIILGLLMGDELGIDSDLMVQLLMIAIMGPLILAGIWMAATGKGSFLIAGYNTATAAERSMFDEVALTKAMGVTLAVSMALMLLSIEVILIMDSGMLLFGVLMALSLIVLGVGIYHVNTSPSIRKEGPAPPSSPADKRKRNLILAGALGSFVVMIAVIVLIMPAGTVTASLGDEALSVEGPFMKANIAYVDIDDVELRDEMDVGRRVTDTPGAGWAPGSTRTTSSGDTSCPAMARCRHSSWSSMPTGCWSSISRMRR